MKTLKEQFNEITKEYVSLFSKKHDIEFDGWIGDNVGEIAFFADYFVDFEDIRYDIDNDIEEKKFFEWYDMEIDLALAGKPTVNYRNFLKN